MRKITLMLSVLALTAVVASVPAFAGGDIPIFGDLQVQNVAMATLDDATLDKSRAKWDYFVYMSKPASANSNEFYFFYQTINGHQFEVHDAYLSRGSSRRQASGGSATVDRYFVDSSSPGSNPKSHLLTIDYSTGYLEIFDTDRVYSMPYDDMASLGRFALIPGFGYYANIPIGSVASSPTRLIIN